MVTWPRRHRHYDLLSKQVSNRLFHDSAANLRDGAGERNIFRTGLDTILRVTALVDSAVAHERGEALALEGLPSHVRIKEPHLRNRCRAHESGLLIELRANFHAAAARNATRERVGGFLLLHGHARTGAEVICAVHWHPRLHTLEIFKQDAAIGGEIADDGKLREWLEPDRLFEFVHQ